MMMKWNRIWVFAVAVSAVRISAQGGHAGAFLESGVGVRSLGMGRTWAAGANEAMSVFSNPAGMLSVSRNDLSTLYSNLFLDSRYSMFSLVLPRCEKNRGLLGGPSTAWGAGWIGLSTGGFEQRDSWGRYYGDFSIGEDALFLSWAHERISDWGLFRFGTSAKVVNQHLSDLADMPAQSIDSRTDWSWGMDWGITFQPTHAPVARSLSLQRILPLKIGLAVHNFISPRWKPADIDANRFPRILRLGFVYGFHFPGLDPASRWDLDAALDAEWIHGERIGFFAGAEAAYSWNSRGKFFLRGGHSARGEGWIWGAGLWTSVTPALAVRFDYALQVHPTLPADNRFSLSLQFGSDRAVSLFKKLADSDSADSETRKQNLLRILAEYPNPEVPAAAYRLATELDTVHYMRYIELVGGFSYADFLFQRAKKQLNRGDLEGAKNQAEKAVQQYQTLWVGSSGQFEPKESLRYGESLLMAGRPSEAIEVINQSDRQAPTLQAEFLVAVSYLRLGQLDSAGNRFTAIMKNEEFLRNNDQSMVALSFLHHAEISIKQEMYDTADITLLSCQERFGDGLDADYPRYPVYSDSTISDEIHFLKGISRILNADTPAEWFLGAALLRETEKLYPDSQYGKIISRIDREIVENGLFGTDMRPLKALAVRLFEAYWNRVQSP